MSGFNVINKPLPRIDAYEKVTGRLKFTADMKVDGMLYAKALYSQYPHARIKAIDTGAAEKLPGVHYVATAKDLPGEKTIGEVIQDQYVFALDKVRYMGDVLAVVAAETEDIAREATRLIKVEYEVLPVFSNPQEALKDTSVPVHEQFPDNICAAHKVRKGDIEQGFAQAEIVLEREYETQFIEHSYIEPEAVLAIPGPREKEITVYGSIQNPYAVRRSLIRTLMIPMSRARVIQQAIGGTFGGKLEIMEAMSVRAALLALLTGKPVRLVNDREESITESHKRHPYQMKYKVGATRDGKICALQVDILADSGAYACMTPYVTWRSSVQGCGPYNIANVHLDIKGIYTNNPYTGSMRGFGSPQVVFGIESLMTELAAECGISPSKIREINALKTGDVSATGHLLDQHVVSVAETLHKVKEAIDFDRKWTEYSKTQSGSRRRGIGIACSIRGVSLGAEGIDVGRASVSVEEDGSIIVATGLTEHGQGLRTAMSQIAAETLGVKLNRIQYLDTDTSRSPDSGPTVASRGTTMGGGAVKDAAGKVQEIIAEAVSTDYGVEAEQIKMENDLVYVGSECISFEQAVKCCYGQGKTPAVIGSFVAPAVTWDEEKGCGEAYFTYVYASQAAEVEVDLLTGKVEVTKVVAAHDVGRAINPSSVEGQIYGGVAMAVGYALLEDLNVVESRIRHKNFDEYLLPTSLDIYEVVPILVENPDPSTAYGVKCIGEASNELAAAAIVSAIAQATGTRIRELPASLEKVLLGHSLQKDAKRGSELAHA